MSGLLILLGIIAFIVLAYRGRAFSGIVTALVLIMLGASGLNEVGILFSLVALVFIAITIVLLLPPSRHVLSKKVMQLMSKAIPPISETEEIALQAGNLWFDEQLFSGNPDWRELLDFPMTGLSEEEQAFLKGPVQELCSMLDDEAIAQSRELPDAVWQFIKQERFLGMVIEKKYGGLGFSASGHAAVISQIATVSIPVAIIVMVPNSLGPGELLHYYGTPEQKDHYLPRLAEGREIPCFALTEPHAGSDAANSRSVGIVCKGVHEGQEMLGIRLSFNKRYITLAPVASLVGLAFNLRDPDGLLGEAKDIGITCALLPRQTPGMQIGEHHDPMGIPFPNGPVYGENVFIPMDYVIGGQEQVGNGWRMLMECLSVGRSISLPSLSIGGAQFAARSMSAYTALREQFGLALVNFEGVRAPLARIYANAYWMTATRNVTCAAVDAGNKPSVLSAIVKYYLTEGMRESINDAMDIQGGAAICRGPRNILSRTYTALPIAITVEGANILTRSLIIFGQGAMRCHPFLLKELRAIADKDTEAFDQAFFAHLNHVISNYVRAFVQAVSFEKLAPSPVSGKAAVHYRRLSRLSAGFALLADMGLLTLAGALKRKEYLSGRYADALAWLYIGSATLKRYQEEGQNGDWPLVDYSLTHAEQQIEQALFGILQNFPNRILAWKLRIFLLPWGHRFKGVSDRQREAVVKLMQNSERDFCARLCSDVYVPSGNLPGLGKLEAALAKAADAANVRDKLKSLIRAGTMKKGIWLQVAEEARDQGHIDNAEFKLISEAEQAADDIIQVDRFGHEEFLKRK
tara:strand:- start:6891 stop:9302 length:2412 start_codon:yes stop_codon:yes gene_type:complete